MKLFPFLYCFILIPFSFTLIIARRGCLQRGNKSPGNCFDHKNFNVVACNCPCEKEYEQLPQRNICTKCQHAHREPMLSQVPASTLVFHFDPLLLAKYNKNDTN
ncbi:MAG: hypothetical protein WBQ73_00600 [Candidatus Babeliales bacterium]